MVNMNQRKVGRAFDDLSMGAMNAGMPRAIPGSPNNSVFSGIADYGSVFDQFGPQRNSWREIILPSGGNADVAGTTAGASWDGMTDTPATGAGGSAGGAMKSKFKRQIDAKKRF